MTGKLNRIIKKFSRYSRLMGIGNALAFLFNDLTRKERIRSLTLAGERIHVRTASPDLNVAISSLLDGEYNGIHSDNPEVIVDAGANIGSSAIFFARKFPNANIYAIEPEEGNFQILLENSRPFKNIIPIKAALWGSPDTRVIQNRFTGHWGYTISETANPTEPTGQSINCITIRDLMNMHHLPRIDILKMDIEGGEKNVFETADEWINRVNIIIAELHDHICMGSQRAFYLATREFSHFEKKGEKVIAYRNPLPNRFKVENTNPGP